MKSPIKFITEVDDPEDKLRTPPETTNPPIPVDVFPVNVYAVFPDNLNSRADVVPVAATVNIPFIVGVDPAKFIEPVF